MSLAGFQTALGRMVRAQAAVFDVSSDLGLTPDERARLTSIMHSRGLRFTVGIQRSWCESRAAKAAELTLSILPGPERRRLVDEWVRLGGATGSFFSAESDAFLEFIAGQLPDPSPALTICRVEQAVHRAHNAALTFAPSDRSLLDDPRRLLRRGSGASLVDCDADPQRLLEALNGAEPFPPLSRELIPLLFAPGFAELFRLADKEEQAAWERLDHPVAVETLWHAGHARATIESLVAAGVLEIA